MNTTFSHALRVLLCPSCNAPVHVRPAGGETLCDTCQDPLEVAPRDESDAPEGEHDPGAQLAALRDSDHSPIVMPDSLLPLTVDGVLANDQASAALDMWKRVRARLQAASDEVAESELYFLTRMLYERLLVQRDDVQLRALVETALETTRNPRYRQVFRCMLACEAARVGDVTGAEDWLAPCDPGSTDIHADSVYRYAVAFVATRKRRPSRVLAALGHRGGDIPMASSFDIVAAVYRAHALERVGKLEAAVEELSAAMQQADVASVEAMARSNDDVTLCRRSLSLAKARLAPAPPSAPSPSPSRRRRRSRSRRLLRTPGLHWLVLAIGFLLLAGITSRDARTPSGHRLDMLFLAVGIAFTIPASLAWSRRGRRRKR